jgi:hypothetical protein
MLEGVGGELGCANGLLKDGDWEWFDPRWWIIAFGV